MFIIVERTCPLKYKNI